MDPNRTTHCTPTTKSALTVCGDFCPKTSLNTSKIKMKEPATVSTQQEVTAVAVSPLFKGYKGARLVGAFAVRGVLYLLEFLAFCLAIPIFGITSILFWFQENIVRLYLSYTRNCIPLSPDDAVWLQDCPINPHMINALMVVEGRPDIEKLRQIICNRLVLGEDEKGERICPRLSQTIQQRFGHFVWEDDKDFRMEKHVTKWGGNLPHSLEELDVVITEICSISLPKFLSPWQFVVIPIEEEYCFGLLLRVHHSIADGVALTRVFGKNLCDIPPRAPETKKFSTHQWFYMWLKAMFFCPLLALIKTFTPADSSKLHGQELCGKKAISWSRNIDLTLVKQVKNMVGTTVNDVMVSCVAGALHDYLKENNNVLKPEDMWASVPVDIRYSAKSVKLKNNIAFVYLRLPIAAKNAVERLLETKRRMDVIKTSSEPLAAALGVKIVMMLPQWLSKPVLDFYASKMSCVLSNVPGPQQALFLGGQKIVEGIFWVPQRANIGLGLSIFSYSGGIRIGVSSDQCVLPKPKEVVRCFEKNFQQLVNELNINEND